MLIVFKIKKKKKQNPKNPKNPTLMIWVFYDKTRLRN